MQQQYPDSGQSHRHPGRAAEDAEQVSGTMAQTPGPPIGVRIASRGTRARVLVVALAGGVLLGATGMGTAWALHGSSDGASDDVRAACGQLGRIDMRQINAAVTHRTYDIGPVNPYHWYAAFAYAQLAADRDKQYQEFGKAMEASTEALNTASDTTFPRAVKLLEAAKGQCPGS